jgi:4-amino-4-deoxy-L-arabinose transferase-like glycosyltransferase
MNRRNLSVILVAAFVIRLVSVPLVHASRYTSDEREYIFMAKQLLEDGVFRDSNGDRAIRAPLFPMLLAGIFAMNPSSLVLAYVVECLLGTAVVWLTIVLALRIWTDEIGGLIAGVIAAAYPGLVIYGALLQTESLYIVLLLSAFITLYRLLEMPRTSLAVLFGVLSGAASLTRVVFAGFVPVLLVILMWELRTNRRVMWRITGVVVLAATLVVVPWTIRNARVLHAFVPVASGGGNSLLTGNNPFATGTDRCMKGFEGWFDNEARQRGARDPESLPETGRSRLSADIAFSFISEHPGEALRLAAKKTYIFWIYPITHTDSNAGLHLLAVCSDIFLLVAATVGVFSLWYLRRRFWPLFAAFLFFWLVQVVLHAEARFRLPLIPLLALPAGWGIHVLSNRDRRQALLNDPQFRRSVVFSAVVIAAVYSYTGYLFLSGAIS